MRLGENVSHMVCVEHGRDLREPGALVRVGAVAMRCVGGSITLIGTMLKSIRSVAAFSWTALPCAPDTSDLTTPAEPRHQNLRNFVFRISGTHTGQVASGQQCRT